jgi:hypothetical protein
MLLAAMLMNITALFPTTAASVYHLDSGGGRTCTSRDQRDVLDSIPECRVRETLVDLRPYFANRSDVVEVIPSHAVLKRCGGGCALPPHSCQAAARARVRTVEVMLVLGIWPHGEHEVRSVAYSPKFPPHNSKVLIKKRRFFMHFSQKNKEREPVLNLTFKKM